MLVPSLAHYENVIEFLQSQKRRLRNHKSILLKAYSKREEIKFEASDFSELNEKSEAAKRSIEDYFS